MAITLVEFSFLLEASRRGLLPQQGSLLEFGEAATIFDAARAIPLVLAEDNGATPCWPRRRRTA